MRVFKLPDRRRYAIECVRNCLRKWRDNWPVQRLGKFRLAPCDIEELHRYFRWVLTQWDFSAEMMRGAGFQVMECVGEVKCYRNS